ncbi:MvaI/BcnI restriction endonuclease family protein [Rhodobacterales bacterium LSUCC0246]|nr:MvaI/BcnI restriction endonuclease family protein [Rhodobacterales bacterium LSUCC0374]
MRRLTAFSLELTLLQPTKTALEKGIMDATAPFRNYLFEAGLHDFNSQGRGARENGVKLAAHFLSETTSVLTTASLYKPKAKPGKGGDPRICFYGLPSYAQADDILAIIAYDHGLAVINLTRVDVAQVLDTQRHGPLWEVLKDLTDDTGSVSGELLSRLRDLARNGPVPSTMDFRADTAIGRTLETVLGIEINSSKEPDYKGIELKSYRRKGKSRENRKQLFAKVPEWSISKFKSMDEILGAFGYWREDVFQLNCTVSARKPNSQGLSFFLDERQGLLHEISDRQEVGAFASWYLKDLRAALLKKHNETFWIGADVLEIAGREHFQFRDVIHTRKPIVSQFDILLEQGEITMDHQMKRSSKGRAHERGPSFKIKSASLELLFPPSKTYSLI